ncbi:MAG TPA: tungsten ABC transporter substrate-binding protein [Cycloclasticus sp.]|jgi:tungstate transport system substrate-binding protein|nr:tungsten ABC transporter substrate-binding protein [Cycloclasticus sp.]HIL92916.1 tungsten ABC transporter substrate-binding protein [Cycloclasticus sp.]
MNFSIQTATPLKPTPYVAAIIGLLFSVGVQANEPLRLATTTSTENSGLLAELLPAFTKATGINVNVIAVGTGKALQIARNGDADVVMVHARQAENVFIAEGFGVNRRDVMENDFVIVGPATDPAGIKGINNTLGALQNIATKHSSFISRGDNSGTHKKELSIWKHASIEPDKAWHKEAGQGMGKVLLMASELEAYTLTDRGTWLAYQDKLSLSVLNDGGVLLKNPYGIIAVNPALHSDIQYLKAMSLIAWITSPVGQRLIDSFQKNGQRLFYPTAIKDVLNQ